MDWRDYQQQTAELFRSLGCSAEIDQLVKGARASHRIDVWVRFDKFGLETEWVVECKLWNRNVPKEKVVTLKGIVDDIGADRGIVISKVGFQSAAIQIATNTNITLTNLDELRATAEQDLNKSLLANLETKAIKLRYALQELFVSEPTGPNSWTSKSLPGVDGNTVMQSFGRLAILGFGFERAKLNQPPYPISVNHNGTRQVCVATVPEFVDCAKKMLAELETVLLNQQTLRGLRTE